MSTSPPAYAPTSTTSYAPANDNINYHQEITRSSLIKSPQHKSVYDSLAEVYSIVSVLEMVENSFLKDYITDKDKYTSTVLRLINQYSMILKSFEDNPKECEVLDSILIGRLADNSNFLEILTTKFHLQCPLSIKRLNAGIPATIEHLGMQVKSSNSANNTKSTRLVAEATGNFITCMDALKLNYKTKEQLHPILSSLVVSLNDLVMTGGDSTTTSLDFVGKSKLVSWLIKLNGLGVDESLTSEESDNFLNDLDTAYKGFYTTLED
ncbi:vacuolar protein sorting-associated protein 28 [[Candida] anglica]|uniref:Vacuolar protein sorting-associated protein 28 n=1 Tax=[Candida] anglica TaxID=148631 RepID=A0ABP0ECQ0_9ASCO